jgi:hypothetical protein
MKEGGPTYSSSTPQQQNNHLDHFTKKLDDSNEDKGWLLEQMNNMQSGKEYKLEQGSDETFKGIFTPYDIPN